MEKIEFNSLLELSMKRLYESDSELLEKNYNINERTVTHRLAFHLTSLFPIYDVDCEYNRMSGKNGFQTEGDYWAKSIGIQVNDHISGEDVEAKTVFPDIIIHKRKYPINLAVIEVKMEWKKTRKDFDLKKLKAYKLDLKYTYALYIEIGEKEYSFEYIEIE